MKKQKIFDIMRWVAFVPMAAVAWYLMILAFVFLAYLFGMYSSNIMTIIWAVVSTLGVAVAEFYLTRWIVPIYKDRVAMITVIVAVVWHVIFLYGLMHFAY